MWLTTVAVFKFSYKISLFLAIIILFFSCLFWLGYNTATAEQMGKVVFFLMLIAASQLLAEFVTKEED